LPMNGIKPLMLNKKLILNLKDQWQDLKDPYTLTSQELVMHLKNPLRLEFRMNKNHKPQSKTGNLLLRKIAANNWQLRIVLLLELPMRFFVTMLNWEECILVPLFKKSFREKPRSSFSWRQVVVAMLDQSSAKCTSAGN
jgi:hypothetical protein